MARPIELADRMLAGKLADLLVEWRTADLLTYDQVATRLGALGIDVSGETVRRWCSELNIDGAA